MTITEARNRLEQMEKEGFGNLPLTIAVNNQRCNIDNLKVEGSGIVSSAERVVINPINTLWFA